MTTRTVVRDDRHPSSPARGPRGRALGAVPLPDRRTAFTVWAPHADRLELELVEPSPRAVALDPRGDGYFGGIVEGATPGALYRYRIDGGEALADPASRWQPRGVFGPSAVVDPSFPWTDGDWRGRRLRDLVLYELHVGTFTPEGTFDAIVPRLDALVELGVTAIELMPVAEFPGRRNWGYDGVFPYAVHHGYGGPDGLRRLVDASHARGLAVILDVVYNHLGPEGNVLSHYGPYFTDLYRTPWGAALNFDGAGSDEVRGYFVGNARMWLREYHLDGLRLDAVHAILDRSARPFLEELGWAVHAKGDRLGRRVMVIPESDDNDPRLVERLERGGLGLDAVWCDDFHHVLHASLTGERQGYYQDFGELEGLEWAFGDGFVYAGQRSAYRRRRHGRSSRDIPADRFVVFLQNHDQVGNRATSDRIASLVGFEALKLGAAATILSPFVPLVFMGEEYGETNPFPYFVDHSDPELVQAVRRGRREEFRAFAWDVEIPDPASEETFTRARLSWDWRAEPRATLRAWYRELIRLRASVPALAHTSKETREVTSSEEKRLVVLRRWVDGAAASAHHGSEVALVLHFADASAEREVVLPAGEWKVALDSATERWAGPGSRLAALIPVGERSLVLPLAPWSAVLFERVR
jgi:maltooligosyltrehalose trehalohydrolase